MVGNPKSLADLRKLDADLGVACRWCGRRRVFDREQLLGQLMRRGKSTDWTLLPHHFRCAGRGGCGSRDVRLEILPFASRKAPPAIATFLAAVDDYVGAMLDASGADDERAHRIGLASRRMQEAKRALLAWARDGITPPTAQEPR